MYGHPYGSKTLPLSSSVYVPYSCKEKYNKSLNILCHFWGDSTKNNVIVWVLSWYMYKSLQCNISDNPGKQNFLEINKYKNNKSITQEHKGS